SSCFRACHAARDHAVITHPQALVENVHWATDLHAKLTPNTKKQPSPPDNSGSHAPVRKTRGPSPLTPPVPGHGVDSRTDRDLSQPGRRAPAVRALSPDRLPRAAARRSMRAAL